VTLPFPTRILEDLAPATEDRPQVREPRLHPFLLAQSWRQQLDHDTRLSKAEIGTREGISRTRVTQVMNLLQLPAEIQAGLIEPLGVAVPIEGKHMCAMARGFATRTQS
jgi:hypothetical protein